jgi:tetratricopeptide (TPR) repeat protein
LQTTNAEAYELYLKGRFFWNQRGIGLRKALHWDFANSATVGIGRVPNANSVAPELNPRTTPARYWFGWLYSSAGRHEEAIDHCPQAVEIEPFSAIDRMFLGWIYYHAGKFDESEQQLYSGIELDGDERLVSGIWLLGKVYVAAGKRDLAFRELGKAVENSDGSAWTRCVLATPGVCLVNLPKQGKFWWTCTTRTNTATFARLALR